MGKHGQSICMGRRCWSILIAESQKYNIWDEMFSKSLTMLPQGVVPISSWLPPKMSFLCLANIGKRGSENIDRLERNFTNTE